MTERLLTLPGFLYQVGDSFYYLGKWICKVCTDIDASDCVTMYAMCRDAGEETEAMIYFQKLRAYSDFALEIPYNPAKIKSDMVTLIQGLTEKDRISLEKQLQRFEKDYSRLSDTICRNA